MIYKKMMKWMKKHPKGTRQTIIMHTESRFTPSYSFLEIYFKYREQCEKEGIEPLDCEAYYKLGLRTSIQ